MIRKFWEWLCSLFTAKDKYELFHPRKRMIYVYFNGKEEVKKDPMTLYRTMMEVGPELNADMKISNSASKEAPKARIRMLEQIRNIFDLKPYDQGGLTETESVELLDHFLTFCGMVKKNSKSSATLQTETPEQPPSPSSENSTTVSGSVSGSAGEEPKTEKPSPSSEPSKSPSEPPIPETTSGETSPMEREKPSCDKESSEPPDTKEDKVDGQSEQSS